jgi:hypothetical protein
MRAMNLKTITFLLGSLWIFELMLRPKEDFSCICYLIAELVVSVMYSLGEKFQLVL